MPDKKCPVCGLWSSGAAALCDCGYDFDSGQLRASASPNDQPASFAAIRKGSFYGMLAALLAALPVSALKTIALWSGLCGPTPTYDPHRAFWLGQCGPMLYSSDYLLLFALGVLVAGALSGGLATAVASRVARSQGFAQGHIRRSHRYWPAIVAGVLFDLPFVFVLLYPGQ